ncbi:Putative VHS/GAT domain containing family protein [Zea mays]|uniref:Putative VHS/GAT domain containing family protein n=1 Tax=Zea mays TaxID=4577 RepID=A0A1D6M6G4_MAIZE|nr:Putative VHS/GAT domain containing family protein [Zea mays]
MYPVVTGTPPARLPAASRVDKATSHLLQGPDWAVNLEICDTLNADRWQTKDIVKAVKKRLQHKDPKVKFFTLTLLETMMKNCGEYVHFEVVDQHILQEIVKIVQKRRAGVMFPQRPVDAPPIFTPPATHQAYGSPRYPSGSLNERITSDAGTLSFEGLNNIRNATELLYDMVNALNPADRMTVKDEIIADLVNQCRSNQQKLMQFVSSTGDEDLLKQGLELNDRLQSVLTRHDAIASGSPLPVETPIREPQREDPNPEPSTPITHDNKAQVEEDEDDEFAQIARRTKEQDMIDLLSLTLYSPESSADSSTQNQNGSQPSVTSNGPETLPSYQPAVANGANYPANTQVYPTNQGYVPYNNYVAPWAQTGPVAQPGAYSTQPQQYVSSNPAPPWAMPASANSANPFQPVTYQTPNTPAASVAPSAAYPTMSTPYAAPSAQHVPSPAPTPVQSYNFSIPQTYTGSNVATNARVKGNQRPKESPVAAARPYYMPDNLFGDLIDVKSFGAGSKISRSTSMPSPKGGGQPMIGRNK